MMSKNRGKERKRPAVCLSLSCETLAELRSEIEEYKDCCQLVEWCADATRGAGLMSETELVNTVREIRKLCPGKKVIVDYRGDLETGHRVKKAVLGYADIIDVDAGDPALSRFVREARRKKSKVLVSFHEFAHMMDRNEVAEKYLRLEKSGADILKIACLAQHEQDTYDILAGAAAYTQLRHHRPIVAIAMGAAGQTSRICAGDFGSVISYACGSKPTAPGQFNARELSRYLDIYYGEK